MSRIVIGWAAALALSTSAAGCKKSEEPAPPTLTNAPSPSAEPSATAPPIPTPNPAQSVRQLGNLLDAAAKAKGNTPCEKWYSTLEEMRKAAREAGAPEQKKLAPREQYLAACNGLPAEVQKCLLLGHAMEHGDTCHHAQNQLDAAGRETFRKVLSGE
jgi:hypothetical protein